MQPLAMRSRGSPGPAPNRTLTRRDEEAKAGSRTPLSRSVSPTPAPETESAILMPKRPTFGRLRRPVRRRSRILLFLSLLVTASVLELATRPSRHALVDLLYLFHFKLLDRAYDQRWTSWLWWPIGLCAVSCGLRKQPMVFVRDEQQVAIVWETNTCTDDESWELQWRSVVPSQGVGGGGAATDWRHAESVSLVTVQPATSTADARHVYTAHVADLQSPATIEYELVLRTRGSIRRSIRHHFPWTYSASEIRPETLHVACFADNQFNVRTFRRTLVGMASFARRTLPAHYFAPTTPLSALPTSPRPHLVLHAGDVVQDPDNLAQWQTDFFDPLTRGGLPFPLGQETPVLLARGNHDWDSTGQNAYTGGGGDNPFGEDEEKERGTYFAYSPHRRMRILVLDSNLPTEAEQLEQERWLARELEKDAWRKASLKVAVVHTAPWIEWWDRKAWTEGKESQWCAPKTLGNSRLERPKHLTSRTQVCVRATEVDAATFARRLRLGPVGTFARLHARLCSVRPRPRPNARSSFRFALERYARATPNPIVAARRERGRHFWSEPDPRTGTRRGHVRRCRWLT